MFVPEVMKMANATVFCYFDASSLIKKNISYLELVENIQLSSTITDNESLRNYRPTYRW